ncbi:MAG: YihY/virulence factor BrkB family protein [Candidatus Faecousia sp.]|nr:YihY/virulence factor BrkB family protein [Candidatus Faecousia sp.]
MKELPKGGFVGKAVKAGQAIASLNIPLRAGYGAYFLILSAFPALLLVLNSLRYTSLTVADLMAVLENVLPEALTESIQELVMSTYRNSSSAVAGVSLLTLLWSSSKGVYGVLNGLNAVYGVEEDRGYVYTRGISVVYALLFLLVLVLTLVLHVFGNALMDLLYGIDNPVIIFLMDMIDLRGAFLLVVQMLLFTAIYMVLPNRRNGFLASLPGAVFSAVGWTVFSWVYSIYVTHFTRISNIYGSVYSIAISMLWLYCCVSILFYGAALNTLLTRFREGNKSFPSGEAGKAKP